MSTERILLVLGARWRLLVVTGLVAVAVLVPLSLAISPQYKATASVLVEKGNPDPIDGVLLPPGVMSNYLATQVDVLKSEYVALRALRAKGLHEDPEWLEQWKKATGERGHFQSWLADYLLKRLQVEAHRDSNVLSLSYKSRDPELSSAVANAFVQAYIDTTREMRLQSARAYNRFFDERAEQLRNALEEARARLSAYQNEHGLLATDEGVDMENRRLAELSSQLVTLQDTVAAAKERHGQARTNPREMQEVLNDPVVSALTAELSHQEARLSELESHLGAQHPDMIDARAGIAELRNRTDAAVQRAARTPSVALNVAQRRLAELRMALERQRAKVIQQKTQRDAAAVLSSEVENAQRAYDAVLARASQTALESKNTRTNVSQLRVATPPPSPLWPYWLNLGAALVMGLVLAVVVTLVEEIRDRRLRTAGDVLLHLQQPLLLNLPDGRARRRRRSVRSDQMARLVGDVSNLAAR